MLWHEKKGFFTSHISGDFLALFCCTFSLTKTTASILAQDADFPGYKVDYYSEAFDQFASFALKQSFEIKDNDEELNIEENEPLAVADPLFAFEQWLHSDTNLSEASMRRYRWAMHAIDEYIKNNCLDYPLLYADADQAKTTAEALFKRDDFAEKNAKQHNRLSAALGQYIRFLGGDGSINRIIHDEFKEIQLVPVDESDPLFPFEKWMEQEAQLSERSITRYRWAIGVTERFIEERKLALNLIEADSETLHKTISTLLSIQDFAEKNSRQHNRLSAALGWYAKYTASKKILSVPSADVISNKESEVSNLELPKKSMTVRSVEEQQQEFHNWLLNNGMATSSARVYTYAVAESGRYAVNHGISTMELYSLGNVQEATACLNLLMSDPEYVEKNKSRNNQLRAGVRKYLEYLQDHPSESPQSIPLSQPTLNGNLDVDPRWKEILEKDFPDGYILNDFLSQFQAAGVWQEHYGEPCPLEGEAIDQAISACGTVKDGHVFAANEEEGKLLAEIADTVADTLQTYSNIYTSQVYQRYREALASLSIFTEKVMVQQVMQHSAGRFNFIYSYLFAKPGDYSVTEMDFERALCKRGGMMTTDEVAEELWFIPKDKVNHYLSTDSETLSLGSGQWMLAEHFPLSRENADQAAKMLEECFLSQNYILSRDIPDLLKQHLPFVAENVSGLTFVGLFNILKYYLKDRFDFSFSIVTPLGAKVDFPTLFNAFAREHETFSMDDLEAYAKELNASIYWNSVFDGGAVRTSKDTFVNCSQIQFDVKAIDDVLESICSGDYVSLQNIPKGMMVLLPPCGYSWNTYLLQSYVLNFSKVFRLSYNSFGKDNCYGAIVRRSCTAINSYEKLVEQVLTDDRSWSTPNEALDLLVKQGYQARRRLNGIENIAAKAKQNQLEDGR